MTDDLIVRSDVDRLGRVVIHRPGLEVGLLTRENIKQYTAPTDGGPAEENPNFLLFDDLVDPEVMREEHAQLEAVLKAVMGCENILKFRDLLCAAVHHPDAREEIVEGVRRIEKDCYDRQLGPDFSSFVNGLDDLNLARFLIEGRIDGAALTLKWPLPNLTFMRDLGAVMGRRVVLSRFTHHSRRREGLLFSVICGYLPAFGGAVRHRRLIRPPDNGGDARFEGGDMIVVNEDILMVGMGGRTSPGMIDVIARAALEDGFKHVIVVKIPKERSFMHLDTIFTLTNRDECLIYPQILPGMACPVRVYDLTPARPEIGGGEPGDDILGALGECGVSLTPIYCGGQKRVDQEREQWSDGANALALAPGKIVLYGRNRRTLSELNKHGYRTLRWDQFVANADFYLLNGDSKAVICIDGFELSRGRGGARCLTLPLTRSGKGVTEND